LAVVYGQLEWGAPHLVRVGPGRYSCGVHAGQLMGSWTRQYKNRESSWWRWGRVELPVQDPSPETTTSVSDRFRLLRGRGSAPSPGVQSRVPRSGLFPDYATLIRFAAPLHDASTAREAEAASTLTLRPKPRGRESTACWQVLRFAAGLTRPGDNLGSRSLCSRPCRDHASPRVERLFGVPA
jgi:hypothetical protein